MPPSLPAWNTSTFVVPPESFATSAAKASAPTPECEVCASTVPSFSTIWACAPPPTINNAASNALTITPPLVTPAYDLTPAGSGKTAVAQRVHAVDHDVLHAARQLVRFERRRRRLECIGIQHRDVRPIAFRDLSA